MHAIWCSIGMRLESSTSGWSCIPLPADPTALLLLRSAYPTDSHACIVPCSLIVHCSLLSFVHCSLLSFGSCMSDVACCTPQVSLSFKAAQHTPAHDVLQNGNCRFTAKAYLDFTFASTKPQNTNQLDDALVCNFVMLVLHVPSSEDMGGAQAPPVRIGAQ